MWFMVTTRVVYREDLSALRALLGQVDHLGHLDHPELQDLLEDPQDLVDRPDRRVPLDHLGLLVLPDLLDHQGQAVPLVRRVPLVLQELRVLPVLLDLPDLVAQAVPQVLLGHLDQQVQV